MSACRRSSIRFGKTRDNCTPNQKCFSAPQSVVLRLRARKHLVWAATGIQTFQSVRPAELHSAAEQKKADRMSAWRTGRRPLFRAAGGKASWEADCLSQPFSAWRVAACAP
jgi:hypothetical protein